MCRGSGPGGHQVRTRAHAVLPRARKGTVCPPHLATADITATQRATWDAVVGTPTSDAAWVQTTLPMSEGCCGVASAADLAPVPRLAGVMQFLARAELMLGCDRQLVVPLATRRDCLTP